MADAWRPLLAGTERARALEAACAVGDALLELPLASSDDPSVASGLAGYALTLAELDRAFPGRGYGEHVQACVDAAVDRVNGGDQALGLHDGLCGLAWVAEHLGDPGCAEAVDEVVRALLDEADWPGADGLRAGLAGIALYALERGDVPALARAIRHLAARWRTRSASDADLTVAHGVPGLLPVLAAAATRDVPDAAALLGDVTRWLWAQARPDGLRFERCIAGGVTSDDGRTSWCMGDPGVAAMLWHGGDRAGGLALARHAAAAPGPARASSNLCCGTAGLAQLYNRLAQATGDAELERAAIAWIDRTLALRRPGIGLGGYGFEQDPARPVANWLYGAGGTALALLAAATDHEPAWDRLLLLAPLRHA
jgi:lantibiotic biosynthesis protein